MISRMSSGSRRADIAVDPARSQNSTVSWRRSAAAWGEWPVPAAAGTIMAGADSSAIAASILRRCPTSVTPRSLRSSAVRLRTISPSISLSRKVASYCPRSMFRSHSPISMVRSSRWSPGSPCPVMPGNQHSAHPAPQFRACYPPLLSRADNVSPEADNLSHQQVEIGASCAMVVDGDPQAVPSVKGRIRDGGNAVFLQPHHDFDIEVPQRIFVEARPTIAEADDGDGGWRCNFELRLRGDQLIEIVSLGDILVDQSSEFFDAVLLQRHPDFQGAKSAARLQAIFIEPVGSSEPAWRPAQIFLFQREARPMSRGVANQDASDFEGRMQPFMRVKRDGIGTLQAANAMAVVGRDGDQRTDTSVHMEPEVLARRQVGDGLEIVDRPGVDGPGIGDHARRLKSRGTVARDGGAKRLQVEAKIVSGRDALKRAVAEPHRLDRLAMATVELVRGIESQRPLDRGDAPFAHVDACLDIAGDEQGHRVGHRSAADQRPARRSRKADHLLAPVDDLLVHPCGGVIAAAKVGSLDRGHKISQRSREVAGPHIPGPEARMDVAHRIGHHRFGDLAVDFRQWCRRVRQGYLESVPDLIRHVPPDRAIANVAEIPDRVVDRVAGDRARIAPIFGVERFLERFSR